MNPRSKMLWSVIHKSLTLKANLIDRNTWCDHNLDWILKEIFAKPLLEKRSRKIKKAVGDLFFVSASADGISPGNAFFHAIKRLPRLLLLHPVVLRLSSYSAVVYRYLVCFCSSTITTALYLSNLASQDPFVTTSPMALRGQSAFSQLFWSHV